MLCRHNRPTGKAAHGLLLAPLPRRRLNRYLSRTGQLSGAADLPARACQAALRYAQRCNAASLLASAQRQLAEGWVQALDVAFTRQYGGVEQLVPGRAAELLHQALSATLQARPDLRRASTHPAPYKCSLAVMDAVARTFHRTSQPSLGSLGFDHGCRCTTVGWQLNASCPGRRQPAAAQQLSFCCGGMPRQGWPHHN